MARTKKSYTIIGVEEGKLTALHYQNVDALKSAIAKRTDEGEFMVFEGESIGIAVDATPRITLVSKGDTKPRKARAKKTPIAEAKPANGDTKKPVFAPHDATDLE